MFEAVGLIKANKISLEELEELEKSACQDMVRVLACSLQIP